MADLSYVSPITLKIERAAQRAQKHLLKAHA